MSLRELFYPLATALCGLWLIVAGARADDSRAVEEPVVRRTFTAEIKGNEVVGREQVRQVSVTCGTNEFLFTAPNGMRLDMSSPDKILLADPDLKFFLAFAILDTTVTEAGTAHRDFYRELLLKQYPGAAITVENSKTIAKRTGPMFDLRWKTAGGLERFVCVAFIPSLAGVLEFSLNADPRKSTEGEFAFRLWLRSFRSQEDGKLEVVPSRDDS